MPAMTAWTYEELGRIGSTDELEVSSRRPDGTLRPFVTVWAVRLGDSVYIRSANGPENPWFARAVASGEGRIRAGGVERDVMFERPDEPIDGEVDREYHGKYDRYGAHIVNSVVGPAAARTTLRLVPR